MSFLDVEIQVLRHRLPMFGVRMWPSIVNVRGTLTENRAMRVVLLRLAARLVMVFVAEGDPVNPDELPLVRDDASERGEAT